MAARRERPELLQQYRELQQELTEEAPALSQVASGAAHLTEDASLQQHVHQMNKLYRNSSGTAAAAELDSGVLATLADIHRNRVAGYDAGLHTFEPLQFAERIAAHASSDTTTPPARFWTELGRLVSPWFAPVPSLRVLYGTLPEQPPPPPPARGQRASRGNLASLGEAMAPDTLNMSQRQPADADGTRQQLARLKTALREAVRRRHGRPVGFFEFCYHPTSFSVTVENVFHTAILVRERFARVELDANGLPTLRPEAGGGSSGGQNRTRLEDEPSQQALLRLDHVRWQEVIRSFNISRPLIPDRPPSAASTVKRRA